MELSYTELHALTFGSDSAVCRACYLSSKFVVLMKVLMGEHLPVTDLSVLDEENVKFGLLDALANNV